MDNGELNAMDGMAHATLHRGCNGVSLKAARQLASAYRHLHSQRRSALRAIADFNAIIELVESRCLAADGPVTPTLSEMSEAELSHLWKHAQKIRKALQ